MPAFFCVRPAGRICLKMTALLKDAWKFFTHPTGGSVSRTARVPVVRQDLKEAVPPKAGTNRNRIEADAWDEKAQIFKVRYLYGTCRRICGGHKREGRSAIPGEVCWRVRYVMNGGQQTPRGEWKRWQKSAEAIVSVSAEKG